MEKILIVDDEFTTRLLLNEILSSEGCHVVGEAENGPQAVAMTVELEPDLILMDIVMPGDMDGISAAEKIKEASSTPIVFLTGHGDPEYIQRAKRLEPFGYVMKPFDETEVKAFVEIALYKSKMERELQTAHDTTQKFRKEWEGIFQAIGHPTLILDEHHHVIHANAATVRETGIPADNLIGRKCYEVFHQRTQPPKNCPFEKVVTTGHLETTEMEIETLNGIFLVSCTPVFDDANRLEKVIHIATDITERKRAEEERDKLEIQLRQAQKMEVIGTLTEGIAHDYNNMLSVILGNISLAKEHVKANTTISGFLTEAEKASLKTRDLTHRLMALSEKGAPLRQSGSIENPLREIFEEIQYHENIDCALDISGELWPVDYDPTQMHYAIRNLLINAMEAIPGGGSINIQLENTTIGDPVQDSLQPLPQGRYVHILIKDNGIGILKENLDRIFDPYFSTKERGIQKGMGLGLTTAYTIIQKHEGYISIQSAPGEGTAVSVFLPASKIPGFERKKNTTGAKRVPGNKVLVMDDEESLRKLLQQMLRRLGCQVELAKDGLEAIKKYKKQMDSGTPFDVVILDLTIKGGMGGKQTIKELLEIDEGVRAIVSSGYFNEPIMTKYKEYGFMGAIPKPYLMNDLERGLRKVIG